MKKDKQIKATNFQQPYKGLYVYTHNIINNQKNPQKLAIFDLD